PLPSPVFDHSHRGKSSGLLRPAGVQRVRVHHGGPQPRAAGDRAAAARRVPVSHLQNRHDVHRQSERAARAVRDEEARRAAEPQVARLVDDDRVGVVARRVSPHPRQGVPLQSRDAVAGRRTRPLQPGDDRLREPGDDRVLHPLDGRGRIASVARRVERVSVARRRSPEDYAGAARRRKAARRPHRGPVHRHRRVGVPDAGRAGERMTLDGRIPAGPIDRKWDRHKFEMKLVNPANKRKYTIIVVGTGLAGASAAASLGELGYNVLNFCIQDSPRRAHSIAAQGGINAAKNYQNDGDSVYRLFYDTVKGGDYRSREANVYRLAQLSVNIIDQGVAQGVPFAREYGGLLDNRSFGGAQVSRTFYARGQTGQQLLIGAYQSLMRQVHEKKVQLFTRREM